MHYDLYSLILAAHGHLNNFFLDNTHWTLFLQTKQGPISTVTGAKHCDKARYSCVGEINTHIQAFSPLQSQLLSNSGEKEYIHDGTLQGKWVLLAMTIKS